MRLFKVNREYQDLILKCCAYIEKCAFSKKEGYKIPHGWSGANAGIPFNIISILYDDDYITMINPRITRWSGCSTKVKTNCGSFTLKTPILVSRDKEIDIEYISPYGLDEIIRWTNIGPTPGYTIQHEIEHTLGILII